MNSEQISHQILVTSRSNEDKPAVAAVASPHTHAATHRCGGLIPGGRLIPEASSPRVFMMLRQRAGAAAAREYKAAFGEDVARDSGAALITSSVVCMAWAG